LALKLPYTKRTETLGASRIARNLKGQVEADATLKSKFANTRVLVAHCRTPNVLTMTRT